MTPLTPPLSATTPADPVAIDWRVVLAEQQRWLRTVVLARLGEPQAVEEVMQEVCLAAVRQRSPLADPAKAAPWLYRLAVRQALLYRRKAGRQRKLVNRFADGFRPTEFDRRETDPLAWLLSDERRRLVRAALQKLKRGDAEVLLLKYSEDWSYHDIAARLGVSHSAVEARLHRARAKLRHELLSLDVVEVEGTVG
ncbi:MAG TPA: RNA polymerase sigma factor [Pirellulales bacterium]|jgi:RNA polymerase sigma-70 factor (ECF subfamily)|nr:RNA polymerase sigma factor [Pirellulales bacterium]